MKVKASRKCASPQRAVTLWRSKIADEELKWQQG
jgi:hypothetical protein